MKKNSRDENKNYDYFTNLDSQSIINVEIEKEMKKSFMEYAMSVIVSRALPDVRDGLKPVHRRILYTMYEANLTPERAFQKSATTVGDVLGKYHPHGDASIYDAMVRMAQPFSLRYPLVHGKGNFGNVDGDGAAAYRYTEAKMAKISMEMLGDIEKETVNFVPNYDDRHVEPEVLPSRFPNLLINGSTGIAVGMATSVPPHNLGEVVDAVKYLLENPDATVDDLCVFVKGPDFPTGGIMSKTGIRQGYHTGRSKVSVRAKADIEEFKDGRYRIVITEIPYMVNKSKLLEDIAAHVNNKRIEGISDLRDESDRNGMAIVVELKRDTNAQVILNQLYKFTQLQDTFSVNMLALVGNEPKTLNLKEMLVHYIDFQKEIIIKRTQFELRKAEERAHILEGLLKALDHIDEVIAIIRGSKSIPEARTALIERFEFSDIQAQRIVEMRLGQLTGLEYDRLINELDQLMVIINDYRDILANEYRIIKIIDEEITEIRNKFADERRTEIVLLEDDIEDEDLIEEKTCVYTLTHYGYIKRLPVDTYKVQKRGGKGVISMTTREEDFVEELFVGSTHDRILFFTNVGRVYYIKGYEISETNRQAKGMNIVNLLEMSADEKITAMIPIRNLEDKLFLNMVTKKGTSKRCSLQVFKNLRRAGLIAIDLKEGDELVSVKLTEGKSNILVASSKGMVIKYNEQNVRVMGRTACGVRAIRLAEDDYVIGMVKIDEEKTILSVTENGYGKRTEPDKYKTQTRGGKGLRGHKINEKTGLLCGIKIVDDTQDLIVISSDGIIIRVKISDIPIYGRTSGGVRVMRLDPELKVVNVATIDASENDEIPTESVQIDPNDVINEDLDENTDENEEIEEDENEVEETNEE